MEDRVVLLVSKIKVKLRENKTVYFWANLLRYWRKKDFRDLVRGFGGMDVVLVQHPKLSALYRKYFKLNLATQTYIESNVEKTLGGKRTLGIHVRGTDFKQAFNEHPICIDAKEYIAPAKNLLKKHGYEQIFLATMWYI